MLKNAVLSAMVRIKNCGTVVDSKCSFTTCKLRFFAGFCLALTASKTKINGLSERELTGPELLPGFEFGNHKFQYIVYTFFSGILT